MPAKNKKEEWEKEARKMIADLLIILPMEIVKKNSSPDILISKRNEMIDFISAQIRQARQQERKEIIKVLKEVIEEEYGEGENVSGRIIANLQSKKLL